MKDWIKKNGFPFFIVGFVVILIIWLVVGYHLQQAECHDQFGEFSEYHDGLCYLYNQSTNEIYSIVKVRFD